MNTPFFQAARLFVTNERRYQKLSADIAKRAGITQEQLEHEIKAILNASLSTIGRRYGNYR